MYPSLSSDQSVLAVCRLSRNTGRGWRGGVKLTGRSVALWRRKPYKVKLMQPENETMRNITVSVNNRHKKINKPGISVCTRSISPVHRRDLTQFWHLTRNVFLTEVWSQTWPWLGTWFATCGLRLYLSIGLWFFHHWLTTWLGPQT